MSQFSISLPADDSNGAHLQFHGVEMHCQLSSHVLRSYDLLCRRTCSVMLCFPRAYRENGLFFAPAAKQMLTITNVSTSHTLPRALVSCPSFHLTHSSSCSCLLPNHCLLGAVCHWNMIPVSGHPFTYLATRLSLGFDMDLEHTLTACCMSGLSTAQQFTLATALLYKLVLSAFSKSMPCHFGYKALEPTTTSILVCSHHQRFRSL